MLGDGHSRIHLDTSQISWRHFFQKCLYQEDIADKVQFISWGLSPRYCLAVTQKLVFSLWGLWPQPGLQFSPATTQMHILCFLGHLFLILLCLCVLMNFPSFTKLTSKLYQCHSIVINSFMSSASSSNISHKVVLLPPATACFMTLYSDL